MPPIRRGQRRSSAAVAQAARHAFDLAAELPLRAPLFMPGRRNMSCCWSSITSPGTAGPWAPWPGTCQPPTRTREGNAPSWTPLPVQYADYTLWQRELLGDENDPDSLAGSNWRTGSEALADSPKNSNCPPTGPARPPPATTVPASRWTPAELHQHLTTWPARPTPPCSWCCRPPSPPCSPDSAPARTSPSAPPSPDAPTRTSNDLVGFFVNTLVLRTDLNGNPTFTQLLDRVRESDLTAYAHQDIPFESLVEAVNPTRSLAHHPLFQVMLTFNNTAGAVRSDRGAVAGGGALLNATRMTARTGVRSSTWPSRWPSATTRPARRRGCGRPGVPHRAVRPGDRRVGHRPAARCAPVGGRGPGSADRGDRGCSTERAPPASGGVERHRLPPGKDAAASCSRNRPRGPRAARAVRRRGRAVVRELNARANRLAQLLSQRGVGPEQVVAHLAAAVGGLVCGGPRRPQDRRRYLPIDPDYPPTASPSCCRTPIRSAR